MNMQDFTKTSQSLLQLKACLDRLRDLSVKKKNALTQQRESYKNNIFQKNSEIQHLKEIIKLAAKRIDESAQKINEVIKENGSSNN